MGIRASSIVTLHDQETRVMSLHCRGQTIVATTLAGREVLSVSGFGPDMLCCDLQDKLSRSLRTSTEKLTFYKDGQVMDYGEVIGGFDNIVVKQCIDHKVEVKELLARRITAAELVSAGVSVQELKKAGAALAELKAVGFSVGDLKTGGFTVAELKDSNQFTGADLRAGGVKAKELYNNYFNVTSLRTAGFTAAELRRDGFSAGDLKFSRFTLLELTAGGYSAREMYGAGWSKEELTQAGFDEWVDIDGVAYPMSTLN